MKQGDIFKEFREEVRRGYYSKGVMPSEEASEAELELFRKWLKGKGELVNLNKRDVQ
ncbi:MAG: hypothetical protein GF335_01885 [Candidatus Moranbacteria bacterium]|nr:hypothetical protein [Candidatus Moranbacteria bacterium]